MADFARWIVAAEPSLGWAPGSFMAAYDRNHAQGHELAVEASPVGSALIDLAEEGFEGSASDLLAKLIDRADERTIKAHDLPKNARALSGMVKRLAPNLRSLGYTVDHYRESSTARRRVWRLERQA
jgi:hypothetical protein